MNLTTNFTLEEMTYSATADAHGIDNRPSETAIKNLEALCENVLEPLRLDMGAKPLRINSGYRCYMLNDMVGGRSNSQHLQGEAADVRADDFKHAKKMLECLMVGIDFDQAFIESAGNTYWLHVSYKRNARLNRRQILRLQRKY